MVGSILLLLIYVMCSALGLTLLKYGMSSGFLINLEAASIEVRFHILLIFGAALYAVSFILNMAVMSKLNLSYLYPVSAGLIYILISIFSLLILKEKMTGTQIVGMFIVLAGIIVMNLKK